MSLETNFSPNFFTFTVKNVIFKNLVTSQEILKSELNVNLKGHGCLEIKFIIEIDDFMYHEDIFLPIFYMFSTFDGKKSECSRNSRMLPPVLQSGAINCIPTKLTVSLHRELCYYPHCPQVNFSFLKQPYFQ